MTESDAIQIATRLISQSELNPCQFESVRRTPRSSIANPSTVGDEWVVLFAFREDDETGYSSAVAIVVIDDATGQASLLESL